MTYTAVRTRTQPDEDSVDALIRDHLSLVRRLAWHVHGRVSSSTELEELAQIGMVALVEAARVFEDRGFEFATYASVRIKGAMIDHLRRASGRPRRASSARRAIDAARSAIESSRAGRATPEQIADHLDVPLDEYFRMEAEIASGTHESLDDIYSDSTMAFCDAAERPDDALDRGTAERSLRDALLTLDHRSQLVLQLYFFEELNLEEIGRVIDVGTARVCQIKKAALQKLKLGAHFA